MMMDLAEHYRQGPVQMSKIAERQDISLKYLEQLIIPLKKRKFIKSIRGPRGGHKLAKSPDRITVGEIVKVLEGQGCLSGCVENPRGCDRSKNCPTRSLWEMATNAMYEKLNGITLSEVIRRHRDFGGKH